MRDVIHRLVLTLAGAGLLAGTASSSPRELHEVVRARVTESLALRDEGSAEAVREALRKDPAFDRLLESLRKAALAAVRSHPEAQDAVQDTLLKIWRGRPQIFLEEHENTLRYFRTATKRNLLTAIQRTAGPGKRGDASELAEDLPGRDRDPLDSVASRDLMAELSARLGPDELDVLAMYADGESSQRRIGEALGKSRYAVGQATTRIGKELQVLLELPT
jgi:RNA polymerase sigma factor (sigma-70 family)